MTYYFSILFGSVFFPILISFHHKLKFNKKFDVLVKTIPIASVPFIIWDFIFTDLKIWSFDYQFVSDIYLYNLPLEEVLFFLCIPFCCLFTYHVIEVQQISFFRFNNFFRFNLLSSIILLLFAFVFYNNRYTLTCFILCALLVIYETVFLKKINYNLFYTSFLFLMVPFCLVNGALTGLFNEQTVVWYCEQDIIGIRLFTIPIEDIFYSLQLQLLNLILYKHFK